MQENESGCFSASVYTFSFFAKAGGSSYVIVASVIRSVCLSVCLSVSRITHRCVDGRRPNMVGEGKG